MMKPTCHIPSSAPNADALAATGLLQVQRILPGESLDAVHWLRREVYHHEQGLLQDGDTRIADRLDASATVVAVCRGRRTVGALRVHDFASLAVQLEFGRLFMLDRFAGAWPLGKVVVGSRLAVLAEQRSKRVLDLLMAETYRLACERGVRFGLIACAPSLQALFELYGFREYLPPAILPSGEAVLRMVLACEDAESLRESGSPLLPLVRDPALGMASRAWLQLVFGV